MILNNTANNAEKKEEKYDDNVKSGYDGVVPYVMLETDEDISIEKIFDCGQAFRFDPVPNTAHKTEYAGVAYEKAVSFAADGNTLYIYNSTVDDYYTLWQSYLGLDTDYDIINANIISRTDQPVMKEAIRYGKGIRILAQEPWEAICSFIISQNNNIPRIKKIIAAMSKRFGSEIDISGMQNHISETMLSGAYSFPTPESIVAGGVDVLNELRTGFRSKYIYDAAQRVTEGSLELSRIFLYESTEQAAEYLMQVKGIGPKVAACALLFGFQRYDAFPIDVWIKRVMEKYFQKNPSPEYFGEYAGIAQQYLFYYERYFVNGNTNN